jgi:Holliday junction resolvasome RuvABC DNA-binding subunit
LIPETAAKPGGESSLRQDVLSALLNLGYHRPLAERAVDGVIKNGGDESFERTLKHALRELSK